MTELNVPTQDEFDSLQARVYALEEKLRQVVACRTTDGWRAEVAEDIKAAIVSYRVWHDPDKGLVGSFFKDALHVVVDPPIMNGPWRVNISLDPPPEDEKPARGEERSRIRAEAVRKRAEQALASSFARQLSSGDVVVQSVLGTARVVP